MKIEQLLAATVAGFAFSAAACAAPTEQEAPTANVSTAKQPMMRDDGVDCSTCMGGECAELHCFEDWTHGGGGPGGPYTGDGSGGWGGGGGSSGSTPTPPDDPNCLAQCDQHFYDCYVGLGRTPKAELMCIERLTLCTQACDAAQQKPLVTATPRLR